MAGMIPDQFQQCVVDFPPERNLVVSACAGSGKSSVLALRAKALLENWGVPATQILILTFSTRSRADLMAKIARVLPIPDAPDVMTYHAYALSVLRKVGCRASVIHASDARKLMRQVLVHVGVLDEAKDGGGQSRAAIRAALALVSRVKNCPNPKKALSPAQQATVDSFNAGLSARGLISFDDMVPMATEVLLSSADATPQFTHILLDEAQDTSESQLRLLQLLAPRGRTVITAVGDADQSIFAFRGAKASTLGKITSTFGCMPLVLPTNYRCCSRVVEVARALIEASMLREELPLLSARHAAVGEVRSIVCAARQDEIDAICREVYRATRAQDGASSIALLCRLRADCNALRRALKEYGVECSRVSSGFGAAGEGGASGGGGGEGAAAKALLAWLRLVIDPNDDDAFLSAIATPPRTGFAGGETSVGLRYLRALAAEKSSRAKKVSLLVSAVHAARHRWPAIAPTGNDRSPPRLNRPQEEALTSFLHDYDHLRTAALKANGAGMHTLLPIHAVRIGLIDALAKERVSRASKRATFHVAGGPGASITSASSDEEDEGSADAGQQHRRAARRELERLLDTAAIVSQSVGSTRNHASGGAQDSLAVLRRFIDELALAAYDDVDYTQGSARTGSHASGSSSLAQSRPARSTPAVVTTIHQSKGLEWDCVYVCHMQDGILPLLPRNLQPNSLEYVDQLEEERRLAYVAFTRARRTLVLTWSEGTAVPEERLVRSRFLSKLPLNVVPPGTPTTQRVR